MREPAGGSRRLALPADVCPEGSAGLDRPVVAMIHLFILAILVGVKWCPGVVIGIFLVAYDAEHVFKCSSATCASSPVASLFVSLLLRYRSSVCILDVNPMSDICVDNSFSQLVA